MAAVARWLGVGWSTVMDAVREFGEPLVEEQLGSLAGVRSVGMDEHRWRSRPDRWATGFCDLETGRLLEVVPGRWGAAARGFLASETAEVRAGVAVVALDPWRGYLTPARELLPEATVTVDRFHIVRLANQVVTEVRQPTQQQVCEHRGRKGDPLYDIHRLLLVGQERLSVSGRRRIEEALAHPRGDRLRRGRLRMGSQRAPPRSLRSRRSRPSPPTPRGVPRLGRGSESSRGGSSIPHSPDLGDRSPQLSPNRRYQRTHRSREPDHREDPPSRTRIP